MQEPSLTVDDLLVPLLHAAGEAESEQALSNLVTGQAEPIIKNIIRHKLGYDFQRGGDGASLVETEDVYGDVIVQLLSRLADFKGDPARHAIQNFRSYVAVTTYRVCADHLREKYPQRHSLKNKLRYFLSHQPRFALWENDSEVWLCGLQGWQNRPPAEPHSEARNQRIRRLRENPRRFAERELPGGGAHGLKMDELLSAIFAHVGSPVELDELVALVADLWDVKDQTAQVENEPDEDSVSPVESIADTRANIADEVAQRLYLQSLWKELAELPPRQCTALLLNLRDTRGGSAIELFIITGVASMEQLAARVQLKWEKFAELWNELPLDDAGIAELLGATRQQVINLRKCARERLARRMKAIGY